MESRAKAMGHAVHPMLICFPLGLLATASIFDIVYLVTDKGGFAIASGYMIGAGVLSGLVAAVFGLIDWKAIPSGTRAKRIGVIHGAGNAVVTVLFALSWLLRSGGDQWRPGALALILSFAAVALSLVTGWLGGELVERLGIGVDDDANLNAPNSLSDTRRDPAMSGR